MQPCRNLTQLHDREQAARLAAEQAADRTARLQAITAALSGAITPEDAAGVIVRQATDALGAQAAAVSLLAADRATLEIVAATGYPGEVTARWRRYAIGQVPAISEAVRTGRVVWHESWHTLDASYPAHEPLPDTIGQGGRATVPLMLRGRAIGVLYMNFAEPRRFGPQDVEFMLTMGRQCAQAVDRARLYAHEHHVATTLQQALLPEILPQLPGLRIHATYRPASPTADVGGDWYDAFLLPDGRLALAIGDVVGHGLDAAVIMGQVRQAIRVAAIEYRAPAAVLGVASEVLRLSYADRAMTTAIFGILDPVAGTFTYAAAGHPAPITAAAGHAHALATGGLPLGFMTDLPAPSWVVDVTRGALLVLYTDGLVELDRNVVIGETALLSAVEGEGEAPSDNLAHGIADRVLRGRTASDDIALVVVALDVGPLERLDLTLPAEVSSLRPIRHAIQQLVQGLALSEERASAVQVAVGEAVNNAIEHAYGASAGTVNVRAHRDGETLRIRVADHGRWRRERKTSHGGRGLALIRALVDAVDVVTAETGTTVSLAVALGHARVGADDAPAGPSRQAPSGPIVRRVAPIGADGGGSQRVDEVATVQIQTVRGVPVVALLGDLDLANVERFTSLLEQVAGQAPHVVIVSLAPTSYLDSQGIRALLRVGGRIATNRRRLAVVAPQGSPARRLLEVANVGAVFPLFESVADAVAGSAELTT